MKKFATHEKNHGPPHYQYPATFDELDHSELLQAKGISPAEVRHPNAQARLEASIETA
jgi:hypothetical protein